MKKEDYTSFSSEILREKHRKANLIAKTFTVVMLIFVLAALALIMLDKDQAGYAGFAAVLTPITVIYSQKAKAICAELKKRGEF